MKRGMTNLPRKFFLIIFVLLLLLLPLVFYFHKSVYAQDPGDVFIPTVERVIESEKEARSQETDGQLRVFADRVNNYELGLTMINIAGGILPLTTDEEYNAKRPTAIGAITDLIAMTYTHPPASGLAFTYDTLANAGLLTKPAYAQGIGFAGLAPLLPVWKAARNVAYSAIVIIMLVIGFMIVFRMKIDPKTVISVQAAIPRIVITLILISLSYPIVGFMIDLMYLSMAIFISVMAQGMGEPFKSQIPELQNQYMTGGIGTLFFSIFSGGFRTLDDFLKGLWLSPGGILSLTSGVSVFGYFWKFAATKFIPALVGIIIGPLIFLLILTLGLLFTFIRLLLLLINSYIQVLISLVLGPIILLTEAIPGKSAFSQWILNIIANLVVFPTTVAVLMFAMFLTTRNDLTPLWRPPLMAFPINPFTAFLGLGMIFMAPSLVARVKKIFSPKPIVPITAGTAISPLTGAVQTGMGAMGQFYYAASLLPMLDRIRGKAPGSGGG